MAVRAIGTDLIEDPYRWIISVSSLYRSAASRRRLKRMIVAVGDDDSIIGPAIPEIVLRDRCRAACASGDFKPVHCHPRRFKIKNQRFSIGVHVGQAAGNTEDRPVPCASAEPPLVHAVINRRAAGS